jgi:hypothetical protein
VVAGGALFAFANQDELSKSGYKADNIQLEPGYEVATQEQAKAKDGTLLTDAQTKFTYVVSGGQLVPLSPGLIKLQGIMVPHAALARYVISNPPLSSGSSSPGAIGDPATGNLEVYYNSGGKLAETAFVPGTGFVQAGVVGGAITGSPTALYDTGDGTLEVYYNSGGMLSETAFVPASLSVPGHWVQVGAVGAAITGSPSVVVDPGDGNLEIYYYSGGVLTELAFVYATGWVHVGAIGGAITGSPKALYDPGTGHLEIFSNSGGHLALTSFDFGTGKFTQTATTDAIGGDPAPVFDQQIGDVEVYCNTGGQLAYDVLNPVAGFAGPTVLGDAITADPAALFNTTSQMSEVYFSSGGQLGQDAYNPQTGTFSGLRLIGGTVSS